MSMLNTLNDSKQNVFKSALEDNESSTVDIYSADSSANSTENQLKQKYRAKDVKNDSTKVTKNVYTKKITKLKTKPLKRIKVRKSQLYNKKCRPKLMFVEQKQEKKYKKKLSKCQSKMKLFQWSKTKMDHLLKRIPLNTKKVPNEQSAIGKEVDTRTNSSNKSYQSLSGYDFSSSISEKTTEPTQVSTNKTNFAAPIGNKQNDHTLKATESPIDQVPNETSRGNFSQSTSGASIPKEISVNTVNTSITKNRKSNLSKMKVDYKKKFKTKILKKIKIPIKNFDNNIDLLIKLSMNKRLNLKDILKSLKQKNKSPFQKGIFKEALKDKFRSRKNLNFKLKVKSSDSLLVQKKV